MNFAGTWQLQVGQTHIGPDLDRSQMPTIQLQDGVITLPDGSHPEVRRESPETSGKGHATLGFDMRLADGSFGRIVIDAGGVNAMTGTIYVSDGPLPAALDHAALPAGVRELPVALFRSEHLDRVEVEHAAMAEGLWPFGGEPPIVDPDGGTLSVGMVGPPTHPKTLH